MAAMTAPKIISSKSMVDVFANPLIFKVYWLSPIKLQSAQGTKAASSQ
jgi:hypothetical protein